MPFELSTPCSPPHGELADRVDENARRAAVVFVVVEDPLADGWAYSIRDRFNPSNDDPDGVRGGIPEFLRRHPDSVMRCWLKLYLAVSYWNSRENEQAESILEGLMTDPLAQGPVARVAERALAEMLRGKPVPNSWWYELGDE